ncbi:MAG: hypothetical protein NC200_01020 [Candidatus Gastranaerophilales bacterium]|nr:hypothetical protein [Candidatus Gastranaerophilales bacterium]
MNICKMIKQLSTTKILLKLPQSVVVLLQECIESENIERNSFIENSIKQHLNYVTTGPGSTNTSPTVEIEVQISTSLAFKLLWKAVITKVSISNIVNEALAFSIPVLLEQNQVLEDFRLEVELEE